MNPRSVHEKNTKLHSVMNRISQQRHMSVDSASFAGTLHSATTCPILRVTQVSTKVEFLRIHVRIRLPSSRSSCPEHPCFLVALSEPARDADIYNTPDLSYDFMQAVLRLLGWPHFFKCAAELTADLETSRKDLDDGEP